MVGGKCDYINNYKDKTSVDTLYLSLFFLILRFTGLSDLALEWSLLAGGCARLGAGSQEGQAASLAFVA